MSNSGPHEPWFNSILLGNAVLETQLQNTKKKETRLNHKSAMASHYTVGGSNYRRASCLDGTSSGF